MELYEILNKITDEGIIKIIMSKPKSDAQYKK